MSTFHELQIKDIRRETDECVSLALHVPEHLRTTFQFVPGQYLTFRRQIDQQEIRRSYSICAGPHEGTLRVAVKQVPGGLFSTLANTTLRVGDTLEVMPPMGKFQIHTTADQQKHYVAFAAGSGITPIMAMLKAVLVNEPQSHFTLFYGNRGSDTVIFREEIEALKNHYLGRLSIHYILSREFNSSELFSGRIDAEKCATFCDKLIDPEEVDAFLLCGPYAMIQAVTNTLLERGVPKERIHYELFAAPDAPSRQAQTSDVVDEPEVIATVRLTMDGVSTEFPLNSRGETILDAALRNGADLPFACKGGVCSTCRAKLTEGEIKMDVNYALEPDELAAGYILTCQAHPRTDFVAVDYDS